MTVSDKSYQTIVIGGGPAGLFAASRMSHGSTLLIEKKERFGLKLLISGSGQCNFTHRGQPAEFLKHYGNNHRFLKKALYEFTNADLIRYFQQEGLHTVEDKNGKIFPSSLKSSDVLDILLRKCRENEVTLLSGKPVTRVEYHEGCFFVYTDSSVFRSGNLVIATGGLSYPSTGSSGDGYRFAEMLGHHIVNPKPALTPVTVKDYRLADLSGISLCDIEVQLYQNGKKTATHRGDIVFTLSGLSGPGIIDFSRYIEAGDVLKLNFVNEHSAQFNERFIKEAVSSGKTTIQAWLRPFNIPRNLLRRLLQIAGVEPGMPMAAVNKQSRNALVAGLCECAFEVEKTGGFKTAMATAGGVDLGEVSPQTMESKLVPGLYFAGEVLDVDGDTGGYNIQAAFSTAYLAAKSIQQKTENR